MFQRKMAIYGRCQMIMYPGGADNHKRGYCADGAHQIVKKCDHDTLPDWPQPQGIFEKGTHFHPIEFLTTLQEVYEKVVVDRTSGVDVTVPKYRVRSVYEDAGQAGNHRSGWHRPVPAFRSHHPTLHTRSTHCTS